jgi:hypothetical protein
MPAKRLKSKFEWGISVGPLPPASIASWVTTKDLLRSHDELCSALTLAEHEILKLTPGRNDTPFLRHVRMVLRESLAVAMWARAVAERDGPQRAS